jgi:hypothetical protein
MNHGMLHHTLHDGSCMTLMSAKELVQIPVWKGNRTIDSAHALQIRDAIGDRISELDHGFRVIQINETNSDGVLVPQKYLIDGQHRAFVIHENFLTELCSPDFDVVVIVKTVASETEAIDYFNVINTVKAQKWDKDPNLLINSYIVELEKAFNKGRTQFIRSGATKRPYLSTDTLRSALKEHIKRLPQDQHKIKEFVLAAVAKNAELFNHSDMLQLANTRSSKLYKKAAETGGFMLAVDPKLKWIQEIIG